MHKHISKNKKLLVVSDTGMVIDSDNTVKAFGPVVTELNHLLLEFDEITWIGFNSKHQFQNKSYLNVSNKKIKTILLDEVGGTTLFSKLKIICFYPKMVIIILREVFKNNYIHSRAPSNPSVIIMLLSFFFKKKIFWHKYAGSWVDRAPFFYSFQRRFLRSLRKSNNIITINGNYSKNKNILPFENPCIDNKDRVFGKEIIEEKENEGKINFCFVGALNSNKGVPEIIETFKNIVSEKIGEIHFVGSCNEVEKYITSAKEIPFKTIFHGFLSKDKIKKVYKKSHFILLPSKSEGFPKVIGEAMNFGCIPIVSNISCIGEYVHDDENGYLLSKPTSKILKRTIERALQLNPIKYKKWLRNNYEISKKFTYSYYTHRVKVEIFR